MWKHWESNFVPVKVLLDLFFEGFAAFHCGDDLDCTCTVGVHIGGALDELK